MIALDEERLIARGLRPAGALLLVKKQIGSIKARRLRIIVSGEDAALELVGFFDSMGIGTEMDRAGDDYHVVADISSMRKDV